MPDELTAEQRALAAASDSERLRFQRIRAAIHAELERLDCLRYAVHGRMVRDAD